MASYTVRVVLVDGEWDDYEELHGAMAKHRFTKTITSGDGVTYDLPPAEYNLVNSNLTRDELLPKVKSAAATTNLKYQVLITESVGRSWYNLTKTKP